MKRLFTGPLFAPTLMVAIFGLGAATVAFLLFGPGVAPWADTLLTACFGWNADTHRYRLDALILTLLQPPLFAVVVWAFYADELRAFLARRGGRVVAVSLATWRLNRLVALHIFLGAFTYVVIYTIWLKRRSWLNVVIGGLAGSFAVMAGGALARPELCLPPVLFATVLFFWSPSHFWSLAIAYKQEYAGARIPMLPSVKGEAHAACSILFNTVALLAASVLPFMLGLAGWTYVLVGVVPGGTNLLRRNFLLVDAPKDRKLAMANFHASNLFLLLLFVGVVADAWVRAW